MTRKVRNLIAPAYLLLCIVLGGSVQGIWGNFALQLIGLGILVWGAVRRRSLGSFDRMPLVVALCALLIVALQLIPLPPEIWARLPGRSDIAQGYDLLRMPQPWLSVSETPYETVATLFALLPPLAMFVAVQAADTTRGEAGALLMGTAAAIVVGALQVASGSASAWYFYPITNSGAVGFFANSNHMGTLLLCAIPFVPALLLSGKSQRRLRGKSAAIITIAAAALGLILIGVALNRSLAALLLIVPVLLATGLMIPAGWRLRWVGVPLATLGLAAAVAAMSFNPSNSTTAPSTKEVSLQSRQAIWHTTAGAIADTFPIGTGLGSFAQVYRMKENPETVDTTYVNHAHNDYLELVLELGLPAILLIALFLAWWGRRLVQIWSSNFSSPFDRAATIASAAILAHSVVDYPLRTSAMAAVFAMCIGIVARFRPAGSASTRISSTSLKHVTIG
jgi:O-antigen ligase